MRSKKAGSNLKSSSEANVENDFSIVGIGASAGGLDPITKLLNNLPVQTGLSFVIIQHLAAGQESMLPEILSRSTKMKVQQARDKMQVEKDHVYVIAPGTTLTLKNGRIKLGPKKPVFRPINDFLLSLAFEQKTRAIGIILSGTGSDGSEGLKAVKAEGGITFAQDPDTAQYPDMPKNAIAAEVPDFVLSPEQIAKELAIIAKFPQVIPLEKKVPEQEKPQTELKKIAALLKSSLGVDFSHYRETTVNRRITRRMVINKTDNIKTYIEYLRTHPSEQQALFDDMLIGVTSFFREPSTFTALKEKVFPELIKNHSVDKSIRVWVPGCSTGEEVYSLAIVIREFLEQKNLTDMRIQIFGTDANQKNIEKARQGTYPKNIEDRVSESRLRRFFSSENGHYRITKSIRDMCIFAKQDITTDPPFSNVDLIICRNVLIYFDEYLHEKILPIFHYGLKRNGFLVLGESESIGKFQKLFEPIVPKGLIYRKKQAQPQAVFGEGAFVTHVASSTAKPIEKTDTLAVLGEKVDHLIIAEYGPATLLVNGGLDILVFRGDVAPYLSPESGAASLNVSKIIQKELRSQVQTAVFRARKENKAFKDTVHFKQNGQSKTVNLEIRPLKTTEYDEPFYLVLFTEASSQNRPEVFESAVSSGEMENVKDRQIRELREDLAATKESLQSLVEGQEATNEELRSSMEEIQSSNEELMSTNEELETAKEELQSGNEELQTLNEELKNRNQALGRLNDDLTNLQMNLDIPVVIVDNDLKIRRFTYSAQGLLRLSPSDVGRSIANIKLGVTVADLEKTIAQVITKLSALNQEVAGAEDRWYEMRIRPYLTEEKRIDGAVLSFTDITERKQAYKALRKSEVELSVSLGDSRRRESEISALLKASRTVLQNKEFPDSARAIFDAAKELIGATAGYVALLSDNGKENEVLFLDAGGLPCTVDPSLPMPIRGLRAEAYNSGKVVVENDFNTSDWTKFMPEGHVQLKSVLFAPLTIERRPVGVIGLANKPGGFVKRDAEMAMAFGELASVALSNSKMLEMLEENEKELRKHSEHMEKLVAERTRKLELSSLYSRNLIEASLDPLVTISVEGKITDVNKATELATGCSREQLIGSEFSYYFTEPEKAEIGYKRAFTEGFVRDYPLAIRDKSGKITDVLYNATVYRGAAGEVQGVFAAARDITERKRAEEQAQESAKKLKDAERLAAIGATAGMVGHDIRNPLQAITGNLYLLKMELDSTPESDEKKSALESLQEIEKNIHYINKIVADLQDFARPLTPNVEETDLKLIIDDLLSKNGLPENINVSVNVEAKDKIMTDSTFITRIMSNLVNNAVQAMPNGGVLSIHAYKEVNDVIITVKDTGVGIPEALKNKLFTPMFTTKAKGQGFGLPVIKRMTEALGGAVSFESQEGKGTTFIVRLPPIAKR